MRIALSFRILLVSIYVLSFMQLRGQTIGFKAFGKLPNQIDAKLYKKLKKSNNKEETLEVLFQIAEGHIRFGQPDSTVYYGNLAKQEIKEWEIDTVKRNVFLAKAYNFIGIGNLEKGMHEEGMKFHLEGISLSPVATMNTMHYTHKMGLGRIYMHKEQYEKALFLFEECLKNAKDKKVKIHSEKYKADVAFLTNKFDEAKFLYYSVLDKIENNPSFDKLELELKFNLAKIDVLNGHLEKLLLYLNEIKEVSHQKGFFDIYIEAVLEIGNYYYYHKEYEAAALILNTAYVNAVQWNRLELQQKLINRLRSIYVLQGDFKNAHNLMTQYVKNSKIILKKQNKELIKELEVKYETLQKEKEIFELKEEQLLKETEIQRQRTIKNAFLIGFFIILIPIIISLIAYYQKLQTQIELNKSQEEVSKQKLNGLIKDQELKLIKASIEGQDKERQRLARELHDGIGGNLASIKLQLSNVTEKGSRYEGIVKQIDETYHQVRDFSHNLIPKKFLRNSLIVLIEEYIKNVTAGVAINIEFNPYPEELINKIDGTLKEELFKIIQELLTNCLKHAKASNIYIYLNQYEDSVKLLFEDDGVGFDTEGMKKGIGFKNIQNRLSDLSGTIFIDSTPGRGTVIDIELPVK
ncbi:ATP-binding protein [Aquimarina hainanensis]|uniref:histidine kinase n=1 Tax=Aquimarina hainanensis TaxID=1578017 RepID=A0ABW5NDQ0_9FLAO|nr:sensor histidine kinase [Aquimarina sp. TRL1]QKX06954.1 histidine kinase [Aquimarina sp. TRL1]